MIWKGPQKEDDRAQQITVVEDFVSRGVDGIVLAPLDDRALVRPVQDAARERIPVVVIDSGLQGSDYVSYVATDNYQGGVLGARRLGGLMMGKGRTSSSATRRDRPALRRGRRVSWTRRKKNSPASTSSSRTSTPGPRPKPPTSWRRT